MGPSRAPTLHSRCNAVGPRAAGAFLSAAFAPSLDGYAQPAALRRFVSSDLCANANAISSISVQVISFSAYLVSRLDNGAVREKRQRADSLEASTKALEYACRPQRREHGPYIHCTVSGAHEELQCQDYAATADDTAITLRQKHTKSASSVHPTLSTSRPTDAHAAHEQVEWSRRRIQSLVWYCP